MALAAALARGDIQVAYMCLVPAIDVFANAKVPIKIIAGTHKYGYGLVVNPDKVKTIQDLEKPDIRIGCVREGGAVDVLLHKVIDKYNLKEEKIISNIRRMSPPKQIFAIQSGQLDAAFLPEQWSTMAEEFGFRMLLMSQEVWPEMQGSVLVVKEELIKNHPDLVKKLVRVSKRATNWANQYREEAAEVVARQLQKAGGSLFPVEDADLVSKIEFTAEVLLKSMNRLEYTININPLIVQETINYVANLGYIKNSFQAEDILDLSFIEE
jgi:NitT/TauT family transport system substrate-binding protein